MTINAKHPDYDDILPAFIKMRDTYKGEDWIKSRDISYLPPTMGHEIDGMYGNSEGRKSYSAYKLRAVYHNYVADAIESYLGLLHYKPTQFKLPEKMQFFLEHASINGESLDSLLRKIHTQQLIAGRVGLLLDLYTSGSGNPYIALYEAETIINWDNGTEQTGLNALNLVVLDESAYVRDGFTWTMNKTYRALVLGNIDANEDETSNSAYSQWLFSVKDNQSEITDPEQVVTPKILGQALNEIPFVFINSKDISVTPDNPPLIGLANLTLAIYRGEADYRQALHFQGQDTLVVIGGTQKDEATRVGAGAKIEVDLGGDAKFIGISSSGIPEMRMCLENDKQAALTKAGHLMNSNSKQESGDALKIRMAAQTANLNQIATTAAYGLEQLLKKCAKWMGLNPDEVSVIPNLQFADKDMQGQDFAQLIAAKNTGLLPLSDEAIHEILRAQNYTKLTYEEERAKMEADKLEPPIQVDSNMAANVSNPSAQVTVKQQPLNG